MVKVFVFISLCSLLLYSCDVPRERRAEPNTNQYRYYGNQTGNNNPGNVSDDSTPTATPTSTATDSSSFPAEVRHCNFNKVGENSFSSSTFLGPYKLCRGQGNDTVFMQFKNGISESLCFFPTTHIGGGVTYIGEAKCVIPSTAYSIYQASLIRNRTNYTGYQMTGVMIMKDVRYQYRRMLEYAPNSYMFCIQWLDQTCADPRVSCDSSYCEDFKAIRQHLLHEF